MSPKTESTNMTWKGVNTGTYKPSSMTYFEHKYLKHLTYLQHHTRAEQYVSAPDTSNRSLLPPCS
jgi:hypothetical protein